MTAAGVDRFFECEFAEAGRALGGSKYHARYYKYISNIKLGGGGIYKQAHNASITRALVASKRGDSLGSGIVGEVIRHTA